MVVEAGTANRAFAKGGRCPNRQATPLNRAPGLHPSDEPLLLCQTSLTPLIGRQPKLSTPTRENSRVRRGQPGANLGRFDFGGPASGQTRMQTCAWRGARLLRPGAGGLLGASRSRDRLCLRYPKVQDWTPKTADRKTSLL